MVAPQARDRMNARKVEVVAAVRNPLEEADLVEGAEEDVLFSAVSSGFSPSFWP